jgi:hypothetical protein
VREQQLELPLFTVTRPSADRLPMVETAVAQRPRSRAARVFFQLGELFRRQSRWRAGL